MVFDISFPALSIIYFNYYQCSYTVLSNMADNKRGRGDRDENQENRNECKSAKAIKLLREVTSLLSEGDSEPYQPAAEQISQANVSRPGTPREFLIARLPVYLPNIIRVAAFRT